MSQARRFDAVAVAHELGPRLAARAAAHDADDTFVADSYADFKAQHLFSAGVPVELGGGGASHPQLCEMLRVLARHCGSSALALSMHTHLLAALVFRLRHGAPVQALLRRIAAEELVLVSSGGSDWLDGSGKAEKVDGGFRVTGRKVFSSGSPSGELLMTTALYEDPESGTTVLHLPVPLKGPGIRVADTWRTLGMRGTGSNDLFIDGVVVPEASVSVRRPPGKWHGFFDVISPIVWPLIAAVYVGVAEAACELARAQAARKKTDAIVQGLVGEMETRLLGARLALREMIALGNDYDFQPDVKRSSEVYLCKGLATRAVLDATEKAMEVCGGASFFRSTGIERLFRDVQAARFHPFQERRQQQFCGRVALGLDPV